MLSVFQLWTALGLLVAGSKAFYSPAVHSLHSPFYKSSSNSTTTCTPEQTTLSPTSTLWYSDSTIASTSTIRVPAPENITTSIPTFSTILSSTTTTTTTTYVPMTITSSPIIPPNPCPTYCSISAGTVNLFYWPTNEPYAYPSTYVDTHLNYTFTSPSVYMVVNTIFGYNTAGRAGPSGTSVVFALDLNQVSTIVPNESATQQLTLSDLGTNCPQTEAAAVIATAAPDGRCDPILAAPDPVKSWASPCNACGGFGLFDPPYAVSPLTGGLVPVSTTTLMAQPQPQTTPRVISATDATTSLTTGATSFDMTQTPTPLSSTSSATSSSSLLGSDSNPTTTTAMAASATKGTGGLACLILSFFVSAYLV